MDSPGEKVVTLASLRPPPTRSEAATPPPEAGTPEARLKQARYEQIMQRLQDATDEVAADVMITVQDREVSLAQSLIAESSAPTRALPSGGQEVQFGTGLKGGDWFGWLWSLTDHIDRTRAHPLLRPADASAHTLTGDFTVGMTSDWGTGLYGAPRIADSIGRMGAVRRFDLLMHLGDVYYSGTKQEVEERFLRLWPSAAATLNRALNGNHEMYSGGFGYFEGILPTFRQPSSYFALQNEHWVLVGLDSAYVDHDLDTTQVAWLNLIVEQADPARRKVVLFSHQQPFSRLANQGPKLQNALRHLLNDNLITAWYWGHEHQCVVYDRHESWGMHGRCLGNGGIPEPRSQEVRSAPSDDRYPGGAGCLWKRLAPTSDAPGCIVLDGPNMDFKKPSHQQQFVPHGFMTLDFTGPTLVERVFHSDQTELFSHTIT